jgi:exopolysaccharide biosynthesis polyprenyl glycosylphosphotransferase
MNFLKRTILFSGDLCILILALWLSVFIRYQILNDIFYNYREHLYVFIPVFILWLVVFYINQLYDYYQFSNLQFLTYATTRSSVINFIISIIFFYCLPAFNITPKTILLILLAITGLAIFFWRILFNRIFISRQLLKKIIIVGNHKFETNLAQLIVSNPSFGYQFLGLIITNNSIRSNQLKNLGQLADIKKILSRRQIDIIAIDINKFLNQHESLATITDFCLSNHTQLIDISYLYEHLTGKIPLENISQIIFANVNHSPQKINIYLKRLIDILAGLIGLSIFVILFPLVYILVKIDSPGPFFYSQKRLGLNNRIFNLYKIRTMTKNAETKKAKWAVSHDKRITIIGRILRKSCIDELPQFWNILIGDMSLVGPRPERPEFTTKLEQRQKLYYKRHLIKPGLTGWAQINMNYGASFSDSDEKLQYDLYYLKNKSMFLDFIIILRTIRMFFVNRGGV